MQEWANKSVLVLGLGETGLSLVRWLVAQGARVRAADTREQPPAIEEMRGQFPQVEIACGAFRDETFSGVDLVAISPGVPLSEPCVMHAAARGVPVVGDIELFAQSLPKTNRPKIIAITGANGKTTVTSMVTHLCKAAGRDAVAAGNISPAVLDVMLQRGPSQPEIWVLELSSFQLESTYSLNADAATVLNITEDHLDRYADMDAYAAAKARIFAGCSVQVLNRDDPRSAGMARAGCKIMTFGLDAPASENDFGIARAGEEIWLMQGGQRLLGAGELQVTGLHNVANALAALALCHAIDLPMQFLLSALRTFRGLPHRVERVAEMNGVTYYDDSKGTNVGATVAALQGIGGMTRCAQASDETTSHSTRPSKNDGQVAGYGAGMPPPASDTVARSAPVREAGRKAVLIAGGEGKGQDFSPLKPAVTQHARAVVLIGRDAPLIAVALEGCGVNVVLAKDMDDAVKQAAKLAQSGDAVLLSPACASFDMFRNYAHRAEVFVEAVHAVLALEVGA